MKAKKVFPRMHVSLTVKSIEQTMDFYTGFFGISPAKVKKDYGKFELSSPPLTISFTESRNAQPTFGHLGIQVETTEELNEKLKIAREKGIVHEEEMGTTCCYAVQDKFWVEDPDGYAWEIYRFIEDEEQVVAKESEPVGAERCNGVGCC